MHPVTAFLVSALLPRQLFSKPDLETQAKILIYWLVRLTTHLDLKMNLIKSKIIHTHSTQGINLGILISTKLGLLARPSNDWILKFVNFVSANLWKTWCQACRIGPEPFNGNWSQFTVSPTFGLVGNCTNLIKGFVCNKQKQNISILYASIPVGPKFQLDQQSIRCRWEEQKTLHINVL